MLNFFYFIPLAFIAGGIFACTVSFIDCFTWRFLKAYFSKERKSIINKWSYILSKRSHCEICNHRIKIHHLIPILGSILTKQKCNSCHTPLSKRFFIEEIIAFIYGSTLIFIEPNYILFIFSILLLSLLFFIAKMDWEYMLIPNIGLILLFLIVIIQWTIIYFFSNHNIINIKLILLTTMIWYCIFHSIRILSGYNLGLGDVFLIIPLCLALQFPYGFFIPTLASLIAILYYYVQKSHIKNNKGLKTKLPFGTFLIIAFFILYLIQYIFPKKYDYPF